MTPIEITLIVFVSALAAGFIFGFISVGRTGGEYFNTYEQLYRFYKDSKIKIKQIELEMMKEETTQLKLKIEAAEKQYNGVSLD